MDVREKHQSVASRTPHTGDLAPTQACALTRYWTGSLLVCGVCGVCGTKPNPLSHTSQGMIKVLNFSISLRKCHLFLAWNELKIGSELYRFFLSNANTHIQHICILTPALKQKILGWLDSYSNHQSCEVRAPQGPVFPAREQRGTREVWDFVQAHIFSNMF